ncbi:VENN motif pre-toxin domain-containing protein, partial [Yersinia rohdei]|uniref:VENN motif pre-toxin domain-containing protein n=1 Tax=Yersinia rohdei TaxID=29485 RepID=UPI000B337C03
VSDGTITIRDTEKQQQNVDDLSRDVEHANNALTPIFDKEKEQNRLREAQLIGEIGSQVADIVRTQGDINGLKAAQEKHGNLPVDQLRETKEYKDAMKQYGTGSALQQGIQAATAAIQGLAGGNMAQALAGASAPYLAEVIKKSTGDNQAANAMAHAVLGAVTAYASGNNALAGAAGAATAELMAPVIIAAMGWDKNNLSEDQKQTVSALATLAAGLAGGLTGDSTADTVAGAQTGKNAVENNFLSVSEKTELELAKQKLQNSKDPVEREQAQQKVNELMELDISRDKKVIEACGNGGAGSVACASARLEVIVAKGGYETGEYNNKVSQMYPDAYGQIVNLLNITSVDAQNQQQVKDAMINYFMITAKVDYQTAKAYTETKQGMDIILASITPLIGVPAANKLSTLGKEANTTASLLNEMSSQGIKYSPQNIVQVTKNSDGKIIFLETGSPTSGLQHIIKEHGSQFTQIGVPESQIPNVIMKAVADDKIVGYQGAGSGRPIYETTINGRKYNIAITVGSNGYVVGANLRGEVK